MSQQDIDSENARHREQMRALRDSPGDSPIVSSILAAQREAETIRHAEAITDLTG